jgi:hypothetical protein
VVDERVKDLSVDDILAEIRAEVARRKQKAWANEGRQQGLKNGGHAATPPFTIKDRYHIGEFLVFHDEDFIIKAYQGLLKRYPDENGLRRFSGLLQSGRVSKSEILGRFRFSPEGRRYSVKVDGLLGPLAVELLTRIPVLGYVFRVVYEVALLPRHIRLIKALEAQAHGMKADLLRVQKNTEHHLNGLDRELSNEMEVMSREFNGRIIALAKQLTSSRRKLSPGRTRGTPKQTHTCMNWMRRQQG